MLYLTLIYPLISIIMILFKSINSIDKLIIKKNDRSVEKEIYKTALFFSLLNLIHTLFLFYLFIPNSISFQFQSFGIFGIDGISLWLIWLINMLIPIVLLSSWKIDLIFSKSFIIYLLIIQILSLAVFIVLDLFLFYINFESVLIPMFFLIAFWGSRNRKIHAAYQFFMYTLIGSLFLLLSII
jgi:NADH-quinone oxidoreductase subunit M